MKDKPLGPPFAMPKDIMIPVPHQDLDKWIGQYLLSAMVIGAWNEKNGLPDRVGRVGAIHEREDGGADIEYEAEWDDKPKRKASASKAKRKPKGSRPRVR